MAATGKTPILLYGSTTATNAPVAGNLTNSSDGCEIAINVADKNLFFKDSTNVVNTVPIRQSSGSSDGWLSSANWTTFNNKQAALVSGTNIKTVSGNTLLGSGDLGTVGTGYGGTGLTSFTNKGVLYASSTSALTTNANLTYDGTYFLIGTASAIQNGQLSVYGNIGWGTAGTGRIYADANWGCILQASTVSPGAAELLFLNGAGTDRLRITNSGDLSITNGNLVIGTSGKGIDFSATAGTGTSELFADYEEGTWTPTVTAQSGSITTYTATGRYTLTGRVVVAQFSITLTTVGTAGGGCVFTLPFTNGAFVSVGVGREDALTGQMQQVRLPASSSTATIFKYENSSPFLYGNGAIITGEITYSV